MLNGSSKRKVKIRESKLGRRVATTPSGHLGAAHRPWRRREAMRFMTRSVDDMTRVEVHRPRCIPTPVKAKRKLMSTTLPFVVHSLCDDTRSWTKTHSYGYMNGEDSGQEIDVSRATGAGQSAGLGVDG